MRRVVIVNAQDVEIGLKSYADLRYEDIYRVAALWLTDLNNTHCLITQRKWTKHNDPGKWMMAASGTVEDGEDYNTNIITETEEEIGIKDLLIEKQKKIFINDGKHKFFVQYFSAKVDYLNTRISIQEDEVEQYKWIEISALLEWVNKNPDEFVPSIKESLEAVGAV